MVTKPILEVSHRGKRIRVQFAVRQKGIAMRYDIFLEDEVIQVDLFAEEVMRWLADAMREEAVKPPTTKPCNMEDAYHCRDTENIECQFPHCQIRENHNTSVRHNTPVRKRRPLRR
ncbi:hypothetical protein [Bradyrhizobium sp. Tv2a-2]|uniref:hypothetical protein n=1 Tax=Bradyrhizobium sp. Tv2a-2 TaxID=113395 RepID=UPI0004288370|nr:hypothetical protein [Bradyrhizobium sp. Tv2a-2]